MNDKDKVIRRCYVTVTAPVTFSVRTDEGKKDFLTGGSPYSQVVRVNKKGHRIGLEVTTQNVFSLVDVTLETDLVGRSTDAVVR